MCRAQQQAKERESERSDKHLRPQQTFEHALNTANAHHTHTPTRRTVHTAGVKTDACVFVTCVCVSLEARADEFVVTYGKLSDDVLLLHLLRREGLVNVFACVRESASVLVEVTSCCLNCRVQSKAHRCRWVCHKLNGESRTNIHQPWGFSPLGCQKSAQVAATFKSI